MTRVRRFELLAASLATGVIGAGVIFASEATLGLESFAPLAQLWTLWALFSASITFGVQQWVIRSVTAGVSSTAVVAQLARRLAPTSLAVGALAAVMVDPWFGGEWGYVALTAALVWATGFNGEGRGRAAAHDDVRALALLIVGENLIRAVLLVPLVLIDATPVWYGVALLAGFAIVGLPRMRRHAIESGHERSGDSSALVIAAIVGLVSYATMFGGPLLLAPRGVDEAAISALFLVITLARIPFVVVLGLLPRVAVSLEGLTATGRRDEVGRVGRRVVVSAAAGAAVVGGAALLLAEATFGAWWDTNDIFGGGTYAAIGAASVLSLGALVLSMAAIATDRSTALAAVWALPVAVAAVGVASGWLDSVDRLAGALLAVESVVLVALAAILGSTARHPVGSPR